MFDTTYGRNMAFAYQNILSSINGQIMENYKIEQN